MAQTANFSGQYGSNVQMDLKYGTVSQNIAGNRSRIRVWINLRSNGYGAMQNLTVPLTISVNGGSAIEQVNLNVDRNSNVTVWQKEYDILHNSDGTKTVALSAKLDINIGGYGSATVDANYKLETIARVSSVSVGSATTGGTLAITINRKNTSAKHTIRYGFGTESGTVASNVDTSYTWSVPASLAMQMPNTTSSKGTIWVDTYFGSTKVGTSAAVFDITVPDSFKPTLTGITLTDANTKARELFPDAATYIQEVSNIQVSFTGASVIQGSSIVQYEAVVVGKSNVTNQNRGTLGSMPYSGSAIVRARVQDSRGRWSDAKDVKITILPYHTPRLSFAAIRGATDGSKISIKREAVIAPLMVGTTQKNTMRLLFKVAKGESATFTADNGPASGTWTTQSAIVSEALLGGTYGADSSWTIEGTLSDKFTNAKFRVVVSTESVIMAYDKTGRVGIGQIPDRGKQGSLVVAGDVYIGGKLLIDIFYPVGTIYTSNSSANPSTFMGGTWTRFGNGKALVGVSENEVEFNTVGKTGGEKAHQLTVAEMPWHDHEQVVTAGSGGTGVRRDYHSDSTGLNRYPQGVRTNGAGGNQPHNNLQPYVTVYYWLRTA